MKFGILKFKICRPGTVLLLLLLLLLKSDSTNGHLARGLMLYRMRLER
jgi:hypothetical protein